MSYHNPVYLFLFLPAVLLAYQLTPRKRRWILLLFAGYFFFWTFFFWTISGKLVLYLIGTTFFTHYIGLWLDLLKTSCKEKGEKEKKLEKGGEKAVRTQYRKKERLVLALGVCTLLGALAYLKYYNFFAPDSGACRAERHFPGENPPSPCRNLFLYPSGHQLYGRRLLGKDPSSETSGKAGSVSRIFSSDHGRSYQYVRTDRRGPVEGRRPSGRKSVRRMRAYSVGAFQKDDHCRPALCAGNGGF